MIDQAEKKNYLPRTLAYGAIVAFCAVCWYELPSAIAFVVSVF